MRGIKRALLVGLVLAGAVFVLPDALLGKLTVESGLASVLPAAAPPLGTTARLLLAIAAFIPGFVLTLWLVGRNRSDWDYDDEDAPAPLPASEQMVVAPTVVASPPIVAPPAGTELSGRPAPIEAAFAERSDRSAPAQDGEHLRRLETLEATIDRRLAEIESRVATIAEDGGRRSTAKLGSPNARAKLAEIRRSLDRR